MASKCMAWRFVEAVEGEEARGYCGLAGVPSGFATTASQSDFEPQAYAEALDPDCYERPETADLAKAILDFGVAIAPFRSWITVLDVPLAFSAK